MKRLYRIVFCFFFPLFLLPEGMRVKGSKVAVLPEVLNPSSIQADDSQIYIGDGHKIYIYALDDFRLKKMFGKAGEGEQEFRPRRSGEVRLIFDVQSDDIVINSNERVSIFTKNGEFKSSMNPYPQTDYVVPMGRQYVAAFYYIHVGTGKSSEHVLIYDDKLKFVKKITESPLGAGSARGFGGPDRKLHIDLIPHYFGFRVYEDKVFLANTYEGFYIEVFDTTGEKLYEIQRDFEKRQIPETFKEKRKKEIFDNAFNRRYRDFVVIDEVDYYPAFRNFVISDGRIYVFTHSGEEDKQEMMILDLEGNPLNSVFVPGADHYQVHKGKYYYLFRNEDEEWELHVLEI